MMASVVGNVRHVADEYRRFIKSTYRLADDELRQQFEAHVDGADVLVKGPYVTLAREFETSATLEALLTEGLAPESLARFKWAFGDRPLYAHQERAFRAVAGGRNVVVTTGTGSGKTESFLLPVLAEVLRARAAGVTGTKAILLYPMNALANDQLQRMRKLVAGSGVPITFALYTGESEDVAATLGDPLQGHELTKREDIRRNPPDIILTNYKQLEFLLVRKADRALFSDALRCLVLDELHSYRGALATELACLIRRLKARCGVGRNAVRCIGTSATVSQDAGGDAALASFATTLFDAPFQPADIVGERYAHHEMDGATYSPPLVVPDEALLQRAASGDEDALGRLAHEMTDRALPATGDISERVQATVAGHAHLLTLRELADRPRTYAELAAAWRERDGVGDGLSAEALARAVEGLVLIGSVGNDERPPLLRPKLHSFFHGVYDVGLCLTPSCRTLVKSGHEFCPNCRAVVRPAVLCRTCGQDFVKLKVNEDDPTLWLPNDEFLSDDNTRFVTSRLAVLEDDDADDLAESGAPDDSGDSPSAAAAPRPRRRAQSRKATAGHSLDTVWVTPLRGQFSTTRPDDPSGWSMQHVHVGRGTVCPVCKGRSSRGDILTLLRTGQAASVSVLATHHLDTPDTSERKLLVFADNRQEAAHQAGYTGDRHRQFAVRHAIERVVQDAIDGGTAVEGMWSNVLQSFQDLGLAHRRLTKDERDLWKHALSYEVAGEFCRSAIQRVSLENLGLVAVEYEFLDEVISSGAFSECCRRFEIPVETGALTVRAVLDFMRRRRAVAFPFYQQFLDDRRAPWSYLAEDPYGLAIPEHERGPVAFMVDRPASVRGHGTAGWSMQAFVKDSERGGMGGLPRLVRRLTGKDAHVDEWTKAVVELLAASDILVEAPLPQRARQQLAGHAALQIAPRVLRAVKVARGFRCAKCRTWRPYRAPSCPSGSMCSGSGDDQRPAIVDQDHYYVRLYTQERPRRLIAREHTAQIDDQERARRENDFKDGKLDVLVCSPTLELGVDIGQLPSVVMRNAPPTPSNYLQRAGRAGRQLRIGYISTFCGMGAHDLHCFEDPAWLVRGEFKPPTVRLRNERIVHRHVRALALEELNEDFSWLMGDLLRDELDPAELDPTRLETLVAQLDSHASATQAKAAAVFHDASSAASAAGTFSADLRSTVSTWHEQVTRVHREFRDLERIISSREIEQKRRARQRAYRELTFDRQRAHVLTYLADVGLLPSYQFPVDTFALDPGVADTPTIRRPAWIALFEFAPGNLVYANGHKLKNIRAFFAGGGRRVTTAADSGGQVEQFSFCNECGFASREVPNNCPRCGATITRTANVARLESFEAEESTQITSAEDARQRVVFERSEYVLDGVSQSATTYGYDLLTLEYRERARLLATNWGRSSRRGAAGEQFLLCASCGRHQPSGFTGDKLTKWNDEHARWCNGAVSQFVLGYEFVADVLVVPVPRAYLPPDSEAEESFVRTLGKGLVVGAQELLEIEPDEIAFMAHKDGASGWTISLYETSPGGAGYLRELAGQVSAWARSASRRLFGHECERACYRCLKSYRNQYEHSKFDKELVRTLLFALGGVGAAVEVAGRTNGDAMRSSVDWLTRGAADVPTTGTPIERALETAIRLDGGIPVPFAQFEIRKPDGKLLTIPDFAYPHQRIAIYCDGFAFHGNAETLAEDARKRNQLQAMGWVVLTFWGRQILRDPNRCVASIADAIRLRRAGSP